MRMTIKLYGPNGLRVAHRDLEAGDVDCDALEHAADTATKALRPKPKTTTATRLGDDVRETATRESGEG